MRLFDLQEAPTAIRPGLLRSGCAAPPLSRRAGLHLGAFTESPFAFPSLSSSRKAPFRSYSPPCEH